MNDQPHKRRSTSWKNTVKEHLLKSDIRFEEDFRIFPLKSNGGESFDYVPNFCLKDIRYRGKRILVEVHANLTSNDVVKLGLFLDIYGRIYHLIVIVGDQQLREWNKYDEGRQAMFHDIWTVEGVKFLIKHLQSLNGK